MEYPAETYLGLRFLRYTIRCIQSVYTGLGRILNSNHDTRYTIYFIRSKDTKYKTFSKIYFSE